MTRIAITPGEPAGIGPDLCLQLAHYSFNEELIIFADPDLLQTRARELGLSVNIELCKYNETYQKKANKLCVYPVPLDAPCQSGQLNTANAPYVLKALTEAVRACQLKVVDALVTGPVQKSIINEAGIAFSGHTEFLAKLTDTKKVVMMLATPELRVALVTTHVPLADVSKHITAEHLTSVIRILHHDLQSRFHIANPKIYVTGLNPHAGEGGHIGREEIDTIIPVLNKLRQEKFDIVGPLSADTIFIEKNRREADVFLAMYHDQGLPVLKCLGFGEAVNITLGLPIVRTSVDHGTALELAGTGKANPDSLIAAISQAVKMLNLPTNDDDNNQQLD